MRISDWSSDVCSSDLRREPRPIERLADIYVAEAGDQPLIEQCRLQRCRLAGEERRQDGAGERRCARGADGFQPEAGQAWMHIQSGTREQVHEAEPPRLDIAHAPDRKSVVEGKSVSVRLELGGRRIINKQKKKKT